MDSSTSVTALPAPMVLVAAGSHAYWLGRAAYALRRR